jgi:hypothetical protein
LAHWYRVRKFTCPFETVLSHFKLPDMWPQPLFVLVCLVAAGAAAPARLDKVPWLTRDIPGPGGPAHVDLPPPESFTADSFVPGIDSQTPDFLPPPEPLLPPTFQPPSSIPPPVLIQPYPTPVPIIVPDGATYASQFRILNKDVETVLSAISKYNGNPTLAQPIIDAETQLRSDIEVTISVAAAKPMSVRDGLKIQPVIMKFLRTFTHAITALREKKPQFMVNGGDWYVLDQLSGLKSQATRLKAAIDSSSPSLVKYVGGKEFEVVFKNLDSAIASWNGVKTNKPALLE